MLPIEAYAPGLFIHHDSLYYVGSSGGYGTLYRSGSPDKGEWEAVKNIPFGWDPALIAEDGRLYIYRGCSPTTPIRMQVLDLNTLEPLSGAPDCFDSDTARHGWERPGAHNELKRRPYIEDAWMTKHNGRYYLQYAAPGTEWDSYADGAYVSDSPTGPFKYMQGSPVSYKPTGFIGGAGHGCLFEVDGNYWKAATNAISVRHMFERRISFYPAGFDPDGDIYTDTYLGDYPIYLPGTASGSGNRPGWMLLSFRKPVTVSSALPEYPAEHLVDEKSRTAWVASGNSDKEWVEVDLKRVSDIAAIQVNYDEYGVTAKGFHPEFYQSYVLSASYDGKTWYTVADMTGKRTDRPHDYIEFEAPFAARYIRWENREYPLSGNVSLRELRIFGKGRGKVPGTVRNIVAEREPDNPCRAAVSWNPVKDAQGYIIRAGIAKDKLYTTHTR